MKCLPENTNARACDPGAEFNEPKLSEEDKEFFLGYLETQRYLMDIMLAKYACAYYSLKEFKVLDSRMVRHTQDESEYILLALDSTTIERRYKPEDLIVEMKEFKDAKSLGDLLEL